MPLAITDMRAGRAPGEHRTWLVDRITSLCAELGTGIEMAGDLRPSAPSPRCLPVCRRGESPERPAATCPSADAAMIDRGEPWSPSSQNERRSITPGSI